MNSQTPPSLCVIGDTHGHLQLALCMAARWQRSLFVSFEAVFLCGDVGTFTSEEQLDNATRRHAKSNLCELEFLTQWSVVPQPAWLHRIFMPVHDGGMGLSCPVVMVHGNHEGFDHLQRLVTGLSAPAELLPLSLLPTVDSGQHIHYLPSGWRCVTPSGKIVAGIGGMERGQRRARYHEMAYIDEAAVLSLLNAPPIDVLITHQGPSGTQGQAGSDALQLLLDAEVAPWWFHGHAIPNREIVTGGPKGRTRVIPLGDVAFGSTTPPEDDPGADAWAFLTFGRQPTLFRQRPDFWREYRGRKWKQIDERRLTCPDLVAWI